MSNGPQSETVGRRNLTRRQRRELGLLLWQMRAAAKDICDDIGEEAFAAMSNREQAISIFEERAGENPAAFAAAIPAGWDIEQIIAWIEEWLPVILKIIGIIYVIV